MKLENRSVGWSLLGARGLRLLAMAALPLAMLVGVSAQAQNAALEVCNVDQSDDGSWNNKATTYTAYIGVTLDGGTPDLGAIQLPLLCGTTGGTYSLEKIVGGSPVTVTVPAFTIPDPDDSTATVSALSGLSTSNDGTVTAGATFSFSFTGAADAAAAGTHTFKLKHSNGTEFDFTIEVKNAPLAEPTAVAANALSSKTILAQVTLPAAGPLPLTAATAPATGNVEQYALEVKIMRGMTTLATRTTELNDNADGGTVDTTHDEAGDVVSLTVTIGNTVVLTNESASDDNPRDVVVMARLVRTDSAPGQPDDSDFVNANVMLPATSTMGTVSTGVSEIWNLYGGENPVFMAVAAGATGDADVPDIRADDAANRDGTAATPVMYSYAWQVSTSDSEVATVVQNTDTDALLVDDNLTVNAVYADDDPMGTATISVVGTQASPMCPMGSDRCRTAREVISITVLKNRAPIFAVTHATIRWLENDSGQRVDLTANFVIPALVQDADEGQTLSFALLDSEGEVNDYAERPCEGNVEASYASGFYVTKTGSLGVARSGGGCANLGIDFDSKDSHELTVQASDGQGGTDVLMLTIDVRNVNEAPSVVARLASYEAPALIDGVSGKTQHQFSVDGRFTDPEDDALCYTLDADASPYFKVEGSGPASCRLANFTITLTAPSVEANTPAPGHTNVETYTFNIGVTEASGDNKLSSAGMVTVTVRGVYGQNLPPLIWGGRTDDSATNAPYLGEWEFDENTAFSAVFTAQDVQPTNDRLCFSLPTWGPLAFSRNWFPHLGLTGIFTRCMDGNDGVFKATVMDSRPYNYGTRSFPPSPLDFEGRRGMISSRLTVTDLSGSSVGYDFTINLKDVPEGPMLTKALKDFYAVVGDESITLDLNDHFRDGDGDDLTFAATATPSNAGVKATISGSVLTLDLSSDDIVGTNTAQIDLTISDPTQQRIFADFMVTLKNSNEAPSFDNDVTAVTWIVSENSSAGTEVGSPLTATDSDEDDVSYSLEQSKECEAKTGKTNCFSVDGEGQVKVAGNLNHEYMDAHSLTLIAMDKFGGQSYLDVTVQVADVNEKPTLEEEIDDIEALVGVTGCMEANDYFHDVDERDQAAGLLIETSINRRAIARLEVKDSSMVCVTGLEPGNAVATVTATDRGSESVRDRFKITVVENQDPTVAMAIDDMTVQVYGRTPDIDLNMVFDDGDPDYMETLTFAVSIDTETVATAALVGDEDMLRVYGDLKGSAEVTVTATDQDNGMVSDMFTVTVEKNEPPVAGMIADVVTRVGLPPMEVSLDNAFMDEGDTFMMVASTDDAEVATASVVEMDDGSSVVRVHEHSAGSTMATVIATDSVENTAEVTFMIEVGERNDSPMVAMEPGDQVVEVYSAIVIDLGMVFTDPEGDDLMITVENEDESIADVVYRETRNELRIYGNMSGETNVSVTATDNVKYNSSPSVEFNVLANDKPIVANPIEDQEMVVGIPFHISMEGVFEDPDAKPGDMLELEVEVHGYGDDHDHDHAAVHAHLHEGLLHIDVTEPMTFTVSITATDVHGSYVVDEFEVTAINLPPTVAMEIPDQTIVVHHDPEVVSLMGVFVDPNLLPEEMLTFTAESSATSIAEVSVDGYDLTLSAVSPGDVDVTVTATDMFDASMSVTFNLKVINLNPSVAMEISGQSVTIAFPLELSLEGTFRDPNLGPDEVLMLSAESSNEGIASVSVSGEMMTITGIIPGSVTVTVTATDQYGATASTEFELAVLNLAPIVVMEIPSQVVTVGTPITVSVAGVFSDPNAQPGETLTLSTSSGDTSLATVSLSGETLTINGVNPGTVMITVTATDVFGASVDEIFDVKVETMPEAVGTIASVNLQVGGDDHTINLLNYFVDRDGETMTFTSSVTGSAARVSIQGSTATVSAYSKGSASVTITASDPANRTAQQSFGVTVSDSNLKNVANEALAGYARTLLSSVSSAIGSRLESNRMDKGLNLGTLRAMDNMTAIDGDAFAQSAPVANTGPQSFGVDSAAPSMFVGSSMSSNLQSGRVESGNALNNAFGLNNFAKDFSKTLNGNGGVGSWSVWGAFDSQNFEGESYEGSGTNLYLGVDVQTNECWLFGVSIARNSGDTDYTSGTATQNLETSLTTILPYFNYEYDDKNEAWGLLGRGSGDLETSVVNLSNESADLTLNVGMLGGRKGFSTEGNFAVALRGDIAFADLSTPGGSGSAEGVEAGVNRIRLGIEGSLVTDTGNGGSVEPYGELGLRNDGGDGFTGTGVEVAGGVRMTTDMLNIDVRGRTLVSHTAEGFKENGISLAATLRPSANGSGLSLTLMPSWGSSSQSENVIWTEQATLRTLGSSSAGNYHMATSAGRSFDSRLGYGMLLSRDRYLLTTYVNYRTDSVGATAMVYGAEFRPSVGVQSGLEMRVEVGQLVDRNHRKDNQIGLTAQMRF